MVTRKAEGQVYFHNNKNSWSDPKASWEGAYRASEVYKVKGKFYLFYRAQWQVNPSKEVENFRIGVAVTNYQGRLIPECTLAQRSPSADRLVVSESLARSAWRTI